MITTVVTMLLLAAAGGVAAQGAPGAAPQAGSGRQAGPGQAVEKIRQLKPELYLVTGGGANTLVRVTSEGLIVVDTKNPGDENFNRLMAEIRSVSPLPIRYVINTQHHPDHVGNNQKFIDAGAQVIATEALKSHMASDPRTKGIPGLPTQVVPGNHVVKLGGAEVQLHVFGRGHSGGDTIVYFPDARVVMLSDEMTDNTPIVDFANGGSALGWTAVLDGALKLDFETAIPGRGEPKTRAEVLAYRTLFASLVSRAQDAVKAGATRDTLAAQVKTDDLGWQFQPQFFAQLHDEIAKR